jgi:hypothetical protein
MIGTASSPESVMPAIARSIFLALSSGASGGAGLLTRHCKQGIAHLAGGVIYCPYILRYEELKNSHQFLDT